MRVCGERWRKVGAACCAVWVETGLALARRVARVNAITKIMCFIMLIVFYFSIYPTPAPPEGGDG
jgi:hypothetical protein